MHEYPPLSQWPIEPDRGVFDVARAFVRGVTLIKGAIAWHRKEVELPEDFEVAGLDRAASARLDDGEASDVPVITSDLSEKYIPALD